MFATHNPVMFIDPSGLSVVITNFWNFNRPNDPPTIPPITVTRNPDDHNNIIINAFVNIRGGTADLRRSVVDGIIDHWGGRRGRFYVTINITDLSTGPYFLQSGQGVLPIYIRDAANTSHFQHPRSGWSVENPGTIILYTHHGPLDRRHGELKSQRQFMWVAAHEFGHALGIEDGWGFGREGRGRTATEFGNYYSIMVGLLHSVTELDIIFALRAHNFNTWQRWSDNELIVRDFGIRRYVF